MNRVEAHELLLGRMRALESEVDGSTVPKDFVFSENVLGSESGAIYTAELKVKQNLEGRYCVSGSIHDNDTQHFNLLEECLEID